VAEVNSKQAILENISREGIKVKLWADAVPQDQDVEIVFNVGKKSMKLKGVVCWCKRDKYSFQDLKEMGLLLENPPEEYFEFIDTLSPNRGAALRI
jgi:hypothetical protein